MLIAALVVGALLPVAVAAATIYFGIPRTPGAAVANSFALAKGLAWGVVGGLTVSGLVLGGVLGLRWLVER